MKNGLFILTLLLSASISQAQSRLLDSRSEQAALAPRVTASAYTRPATDTTLALFGKVLTAQTTGDRTATMQALQAGTTALETEAKMSSGSFGDKLTAQANQLKKLIPLATSEQLESAVLRKAVGLAQLALAGHTIEQLLGEPSLLPNAGNLTANLGFLKSALPALGESTASSGDSLIDSALSNVSRLAGGGATAPAAESAMRSQLNSVLSFVKGML